MVRIPAASVYQNVQAGFEANPATYSAGTGISFPGLKRPKRKADHTLLSVSWLRMSRAIPPLLLCIMVFIATFKLFQYTVYYKKRILAKRDKEENTEAAEAVRVLNYPQLQKTNPVNKLF
jgi:hypothetical protein